MTCPRLPAQAQCGGRTCWLIPSQRASARGHALTEETEIGRPCAQEDAENRFQGSIAVCTVGCPAGGQVSVSSSHNRTRSAPSEEVDPKLHLVTLPDSSAGCLGKDVLPAT